MTRTGWRGESHRHSLSAKGIKTGSRAVKVYKNTTKKD